MNMQNFCQSCSMPLDNDKVKGTEKDGSLSNEYCKYCYENGAFTTPGMSMKEMETIVVSEMKKKAIPQNIIDMAVNSLPYLKRWQTK